MDVFPLVLLGAALVPGQNQSHEQLNPVFRELRQQGVPLGGKLQVPLPAPTMADGLSAREQKALLKKLIADDFEYDEFVRDSVVAPHLLKIRESVKPSDPKAPTRGVDFWFVAYGDLDALANKTFLERLMKTNQKEGKARELKKEDLEKRGVVQVDAKHESYGHVTFPFLNKVEISAVGRSHWSRLPDSVVLAARLDPRFVGDKEFPSQWRSLEPQGNGKVKLGPPHPYDGA